METGLFNNTLDQVDTLLAEILEKINRSEVWQRVLKRLFDTQVKRYEQGVKDWFEFTRKQIVGDLNKKFAKAASPIKITSNLTDWNYIQESGKSVLKPVTLDVMGEVGKESFRIAGATGSFDVVNVHAVAMADKICAKLVKEVTDNTKEGIAAAIKQGIVEGKAMPQVAKDIKEIVGLTGKQVTAVHNYKKHLIKTKPYLSVSQVEKKVGAYQRKLHKYRANLIARTETARAQSEGTLEGFRQSGVEVVKFLTAAGCCPICADLNGREFTIDEASGMIPVHPGCRCAWLSTEKKKVPAIPKVPKVPTIPVAPIIPKPVVGTPEYEKVMSTGDITSTNKLGQELSGVNITEKVAIKGNGSGVFKPIAGEQKWIQERVGGSLASRERASYLISKELGFDNVPTTIIRKVKGKKGSVQYWVDDAVLAQDFGHTLDDVAWFRNESSKMEFFDLITMNNDRHGGNYLVNASKKKLIWIDNGFSLYTDAGLSQLPSKVFFEGYVKLLPLVDRKIYKDGLEKVLTKDFEKMLLETGLEKGAIQAFQRNARIARSAL